MAFLKGLFVINLGWLWYWTIKLFYYSYLFPFISFICCGCLYYNYQWIFGFYLVFWEILWKSRYHRIMVAVRPDELWDYHFQFLLNFNEHQNLNWVENYIRFYYSITDHCRWFWHFIQFHFFSQIPCLA